MTTVTTKWSARRFGADVARTCDRRTPPAQVGAECAAQARLQGYADDFVRIARQAAVTSHLSRQVIRP